MKEFFSNPAFYWSLLVIVILFALLSFIKRFLIKKVAYTNKDSQHANTFMGVVFSLLQYLVVIIAIFVLLKINGVDVTAMLAGLGIVATIVGLSLQDTLKDLFSGINIFNNNFYKVGDIVKYNGEKCEVKYFNARVTKFRSLASDSTFTVCNSQINAIEKIKDKNSAVFCFSYKIDPKKIDKILTPIVKEIEDLKGVSEVKYLGAIGFASNGVKYAFSFKANGRYSGSANTLLNKRVYEECYKAKIHVKFDDEINLNEIKGTK